MRWKLRRNGDFDAIAWRGSRRRGSLLVVDENDGFRDQCGPDVSFDLDSHVCDEATTALDGFAGFQHLMRPDARASFCSPLAWYSQSPVPASVISTGERSRGP